jgi:hypothetical protein
MQSHSPGIAARGLLRRSASELRLALGSAPFHERAAQGQAQGFGRTQHILKKSHNVVTSPALGNRFRAALTGPALSLRCLVNAPVV